MDDVSSNICQALVAGKVLGGVVMIFGIVVIALPITVIGSNFATIYKKMVIDEKISEEEAAGDLDDEEDDDNEDGEEEADGDSKDRDMRGLEAAL